MQTYVWFVLLIFIVLFLFLIYFLWLYWCIDVGKLEETRNYEGIGLGYWIYSDSDILHLGAWSGLCVERTKKMDD